ncbi:glycosyltransferase family 4 protein [Rhodovastum atsumiense]|uniref:glycosyltransferase family 4 protein n=1 Tax=Rhodovastum atsumiense TaxID=504468 RepID=UPI0020249FEE|nr:glycosyltransferase family 4 protein [Rhodovastum atsumiense]
MRILFVHQNFPGQFGHLAQALVKAGHQVLALAIESRGAVPGIEIVRYQPDRGSTPNIHRLAVEFETKTIRGEACARAAAGLRQRGFTPDIIVAHPGWGESLFLKDVWPDVPLLCFLEFYYRLQGADVGFDPEFPPSGWEGAARVRAKNAHLALTLETMDRGYSPTHWQKAVHPTIHHPKIEVIHDGIDTALLAPDATRALKLGETGPTLVPGDEVLTFVARNLEPYRGYHVFMRALPEIQRRRPHAVTLIVGGEGVSYGQAPASGTWKQRFLNEVRDRLDMSRVFFLGKLPYDDYLTVLRLSRCHIYLTYPFVLSWSMLEAMSTGCLVLGSATPPVQEVIEDGVNGLLVDFFDTDLIAEKASLALDRFQNLLPLRQAARQTVVDRYDLVSVCLPAQLALLDRLASAGPVMTVAEQNRRL